MCNGVDSIAQQICGAMPSKSNVMNFILQKIFLTEIPPYKEHRTKVCYRTQRYDYSIPCAYACVQTLLCLHNIFNVFYKIITTVQQKPADQSLESLKYNALQYSTKHYIAETDLVALLGSRGLTE